MIVELDLDVTSEEWSLLSGAVPLAVANFKRDHVRRCQSVLHGEPCGRLFFRVRAQKYCSRNCVAREYERRRRAAE